MTPRWLPQKPGMTTGMPWIVPFAESAAGQSDEIRSRKDLVLMAGDDGVDSRHLGQVPCRVFLKPLARFRGKPAVA